MKGALAAVTVALAFPATAWGEATLVTRDLPVGGARTLAASAPATRFNLVGLHWRGPGRVYFRTRAQHGWGGWHEADAEPEDLPDRGTAEARRMRGWRIGNPWWTGTAERIQVRTRGRVERVRAHFVWSPEEPMLERSLQIAGSPKIILRRSWGAHARAVGGGRPRDPGLPRARKRLGRHRLQLPRRPLRPGLRGALGRRRAERDRRACAGVQYGLRRDCGDRELRRRCAVGCCSRRAESADLLAPRCRSRLSAGAYTVDLLGKSEVPQGPPNLASYHLGTSRHRLHQLSRRRPLRPARGGREPCCSD